MGIVDLFNWMVANWGPLTAGLVGLGAAFAGIVAAASVISKLTPWEWDNKVCDVLQKVIDFLALQKKPPA